MTRNTVYWICQLGGWSLYGVINIFFFLLNGASPEQVLNLFLAVLYSLLITHAFRAWVHRRRWLKLSTGRLVPRIILAILIMSALVYGLQLATFYLQDNLAAGLDLTLALLNILTNMTIFFIWCVIYIAYHYVERYNATLRYEAALNEMTLNRLKSQLNPHFIFNALNSIRALVDEDPQKSKKAITQLSNILRNSLVMDKRSLVRFQDELQTVKDYLALEGIRFEERLRIQYNISPEASDFQVPPMMLQTLVENGIKHGISNLIDGGIVHIDALVKEQKLHVCVRNSGQYVNGVKKKNGSGVGLANTKQRLALLYGHRAHFSIKNENDKTVLTELVIPQH
ncbi:sensor histidine kinase [Cesiribacter sp. SM1]|uniref:sensor histidine kinase n=1 Tax=Cesiribacter sp. SM1 TaxID=2861196 RepID=UPI001CD48A98|nr:histidine kinase [Cesiribacter sp. SM1]